ncbi:hypothetical protein PHMEG_00032333 [Phytophthora megakarya]|uniref:Uncharacterized protein n=1 Tax=Phytophthora megakarya TaxID=4795 RepID=A0A225UWM8_9STRA|nr:hypothetical protein PHMEG_00032333 [Phytophthora megakarya]
MQQIDYFLMGPKAAIMNAARANEIEWLDQLLTRFKCDVAKALVVAAAKGHQLTVQILLRAISEHSRKQKEEAYKVFLRATLVAGKNNHLDLVKLLMTKADEAVYTIDRTYFVVSFDKVTALQSTIQHLANIAASRGHLEVVQFVVSFVKKKKFETIVSIGLTALEWALRGEQSHVVEFLLNVDEFRFDLVRTFADAVDSQRYALANTIYNKFQTKPGENMFFRLAQRGYTNAVKFLHKNAAKTQIQAARYIDIHISAAAISQAFEVAGSAGTVNPKLMIFLYKTGSVSPQSVLKVFETTGNFKVVKYLLKNERIPDKSMIAAFETATGNGATASSPEQDLIASYLIHAECIRSETICKAFVKVTAQGRSYISSILRKDRRLSTSARDEGFVSAGGSGHFELMESLYDEQHTTPEAILQAFTKALVYENKQVMEFLVKLLSDEERVPRYFMHKAFVKAAKRKYGNALKLLNRYARANWPLDVLKEAHSVATYITTKNFIYELTCQQHCDSMHQSRLKVMAKLTENWKDVETKTNRQ